MGVPLARGRCTLSFPSRRGGMVWVLRGAAGISAGAWGASRRLVAIFVAWKYIRVM